MQLGKPEISLNVSSLKDSLAFYATLGFKQVEGDPRQGWAVLKQTGIRLGLYEGHGVENSISFFGGDVESIAGKLHEGGYSLESGPVQEQDGTKGAKVLDPDGNLLYFNA